MRFPLIGTDWPQVEVEHLVGVTLTGVYRAQADIHFRGLHGNGVSLRRGDLLLTAQDGRAFLFTHEQDCCEDVELEVLTWTGSVPTVVRVAEEKSNQTDRDGGSTTWTFWALRCDSGDLDMTWQGSSNGYYSESPSIFEVPVNTEVPLPRARWEPVT